MKKNFAEFVSSGKSAKKFIEEVQTSDSLSGSLGDGGTTINKDGNAAAAVTDADNLDIPVTGPTSDATQITEDADPLGSGSAPAPTSPEANKDQTLAEDADPLGTGPAPTPTTGEANKDQSMPECGRK